MKKINQFLASIKEEYQSDAANAVKTQVCEDAKVLAADLFKEKPAALALCLSIISEIEDTIK